MRSIYSFNGCNTIYNSFQSRFPIHRTSLWSQSCIWRFLPTPKQIVIAIITLNNLLFTNKHSLVWHSLAWNVAKAHMCTDTMKKHVTFVQVINLYTWLKKRRETIKKQPQMIMEELRKESQGQDRDKKRRRTWLKANQSRYKHVVYIFIPLVSNCVGPPALRWVIS